MMKTTQRWPGRSGENARVWRRRGAAGILAMLLVLSAVPASAALVPRTPLVRPRRTVAQELQPVRAKTAARGVSAQTPKRRVAGSLAGNSAKKFQAKSKANAGVRAKAGSEKNAQARGRRRPPVTEVDDPPAKMYRAGGAREAASETKPAEQVAERKPLTVEDFERAANGEASAEPAAKVTPVVNDAEKTARASARPPLGERLPMMAPEPVRRAAASAPKPLVVASSARAGTSKAATPKVEARVEANDVLAAPIERATALPRLEARGAVDSDAGEPAVVSAGAASEKTSAQDADAIEAEVDAAEARRAAVLRAPSHEEMAEAAVQPMVLPGLYRDGRLLVPAPLKGSREVLVHQNTMADEEGLERIRSDRQLNDLRASHALVNLPETESLHLNPELGANRRCARAWSVKFAVDMSRAFYARFREPLTVTSAVRTVAYQLRLQRVNGNAAGIGGEAASPHLTGQALDFAKSGMNMEEIAWMRGYLLPLMQAGKVDVEEEFQQACFHVSVYRSYMPVVPARPRVARTLVAQVRASKIVPPGDEERQ